MLWAQGKVKETAALGEHLIRTRRIWTELGSRTLHIEDIVENLGYQDSPHMYLFHINIGFPILFVGGVYELVGDWQNLKDPTPAVVDFTNDRAREAVRWTASLYLTAWQLSESIKLPGWLDRAQNDTHNQ